MIVARTLKGKGVSSVEGKDGWHGKAFKKGEELDRALAELDTVRERRRRRCRVPDRQAVAGASRRRRSRSLHRLTRRGSRSRRAKRPAPPSPSSVRPTSVWSRSTPMSRTRPSVNASRRSRRTASIRTSSQNRSWWGRRRGWPRAGRSVPVDVRLLLGRARLTSSGWPRSATST